MNTNQVTDIKRPRASKKDVQIRSCSGMQTLVWELTIPVEAGYEGRATLLRRAADLIDNTDPDDVEVCKMHWRAETDEWVLTLALSGAAS